MTACGVPFQEKPLGLFTPEFEQEVRQVNPAGLVPVLLDGDLAVWDSLAICEYVAERHPDRQLWPADARARARARSLTAQMHSGFTALRNALGMNIEAHLPDVPLSDAVRQDIDRIQALWRDARAEFGSDGPFLFGQFSIADAFYAPVVSRFTTYGVAVTDETRAYMDAVLNLPAMQQWTQAALAEGIFVPEDEPYRSHR